MRRADEVVRRDKDELLERRTARVSLVRLAAKDAAGAHPHRKGSRPLSVDPREAVGRAGQVRHAPVDRLAAAPHQREPEGGLARAVEAVSLEERLELAVREEDEVVALLLGAELDRGVQLRRGHRQVDWAGVSRRNRLAAAEDDVLKAAPLAKLSQHLADLAAAHNHRRLVLSRLDLRLSEKEVEILLRGAAVRVDLQSRQPRARAASSGWR
mmetsp:Transcript_24355/g.79330  ORF Transcript_24355/g.79330 Transcript_24355/m.79330 type:complete len:212 (-) Transcript_24355:83-718(-)